MKHLLPVIILLLFPFALTSGQDVAGKQSRKAKLEREVALIEKQLEQTAAKSSSASARLALINNKVNARKAIVRENERELAAINDSLRLVNAEVGRVQVQLDTMMARYARLVRSAYKNRDNRVWYMYLLSSRDFVQAARRLGYLKSLSSRMTARAGEILRTKENLERQKQRLSRMQQRSKAVMDANLKELDALKKEQSQSERLVGELKRQKSAYQKSIKTKKQQVLSLDREIQKLISQQVKGDAGGKKSSSPVDVKLSGEFQANKGKLPWPCEGTVIGHFGKRVHPVYKNLQLPFSNGIDIGTVRGAGVKAVFGGEVKKVIAMPGYNKCVLLQHGSYFSFYCKLGSVDVKAGDKVKTGQVIGTVDTIDGSTQLHFQLWLGTKPQDPESWLRPL